LTKVPGKTRAARGDASRRLFFALWPPDAVRDALFEWARVCHLQTQGRLIDRSNLHATLAFLGMIDRERYEMVLALAARVHGSRFELVLDRIGYWPHNRIVYAGTRRMPAALSELATELARELAQAGFATEERRYVPHVTLVRDGACAPSRIPASSLRWQVEALVLVESRHDDARLVYRPLQRWTLTG
jgi:2'-5' RNA ligase